MTQIQHHLSGIRVGICLLAPLVYCLLFTSCREDELLIPTEYVTLPVAPEPLSDPVGMYLLNEGNMGRNQATLDFLDFRGAVYSRNIYAERNPEVVMELGDVGNDLRIYGSKLYAVINCSHKVEVMDAVTCRKIAQIDIPNCRYIRFAKGEAYVTSYVGAVSTDSDDRLGAVYRVDTTSLQVTGEVAVGYQPDEMEFLGDYLYVANSGAYRAPDYDRTLSIVNSRTMKQVARVNTLVNPGQVRKDRYGKLWVTSRGNYDDIPSRLFVMERTNGDSPLVEVTDSLDISCRRISIAGDSLYFYGTGSEGSPIYGIIDVKSRKVLTENFISDGSDKEIKTPYGLQIDPRNGDIYITDAKNYVSGGILFCYDKKGMRKWSVRTGDIPAVMEFLYR